MPPCNKKGKLNDGSISPSSSSSNSKVETTPTGTSDRISRILSIAGPMFKPINFIREGGCSTSVKPVDTYLGIPIITNQPTSPTTSERKRHLDSQENDKDMNKEIESISEQISTCMRTASEWGLRRNDIIEPKTLPNNKANCTNKRPSESGHIVDLDSFSVPISFNDQDFISTVNHIPSANELVIDLPKCSKDSLADDDNVKLQRNNTLPSPELPATLAPCVLTNKIGPTKCNEPVPVTEIHNDMSSPMCSVRQSSFQSNLNQKEKSPEKSIDTFLSEGYSAESRVQNFENVRNLDERVHSMHNTKWSSSDPKNLEREKEMDLDTCAVIGNTLGSSDVADQNKKISEGKKDELAPVCSSNKTRIEQQNQSVWVRRRILFGNTSKSSLNDEMSRNSEMNDIKTIDVIGNAPLSIRFEDFETNPIVDCNSAASLIDESQQDVIQSNDGLCNLTEKGIPVSNEDLDESRNTPVIDEISRVHVPMPETIGKNHPFDISHPGIVFDPHPDTIYSNPPPMVIYAGNPSTSVIDQPGVHFPILHPQIFYRPPLVAYPDPRENVRGSHSQNMYERYAELIHDSHMTRQRRHSEESHLGLYTRRKRGRSEERYDARTTSIPRGHSEESHRGYVSTWHRNLSEEMYNSRRRRSYSEESFDNRSIRYGSSGRSYDGRSDDKYYDRQRVEFKRASEDRRSSTYEGRYVQNEEHDNEYEERGGDYYNDQFNKNHVNHYDDRQQNKGRGTEVQDRMPRQTGHRKQSAAKVKPDPVMRDEPKSATSPAKQ